MRKALLFIIACLTCAFAYADSIFFDGFEYANHDMESPCGWICNDQSWLCGYLDKDHNRSAHTGNWYVFTNAEDSWMFMPLFMSDQLRYRYSCWAISDGSYELEFWAGNDASQGSMEQLLLSTTINSGTYNHVLAYVEEISSQFQYLGIHAVASTGAYHLTIDDINVDMVNKYEFQATPSDSYTSLAPGEQTTFSFKVQDLGYEPIDVILSPSHEYFPQVSFSVDDTPCTVFHLEPNEIKTVVTTATLSSNVTPGSTCWLDIMLVLDCNCATSMTTLWVTVTEPTEVEEHHLVGLYPNPSHGDICIEGSGIVTIANNLGQIVMTKWIDGKETLCLPKGIYIIRVENGDGIRTEKLTVD